MGKSASATWVVFGMALLMTIVIIDAQTFFTNGRYGKRSPDFRFRVSNRSPDERIFGGPRFGRSGGAGAVILSNAELDRNPERFFIGSRYGKRSSDTTERATSAFQQDEQQQVESALNSFDKDSVLVCFPTGFEQLFHCERKTEITKPQEGE